MDVRRRPLVALTVLFVTSLGPFSAAQTSRAKYDPAAKGHPPQPQQSFLDFTLKGMNPAETDYGECIDESRKLLLSETIDDRYFWSNAVGACVLVGLFVIIVFEDKRYRRSEWMAAEGLAQYDHALALARGEFAEAKKRNEGLMKSLSSVRESVLGQPTLSPEALSRATGVTPSRVSTAHKKSTGTPANGNNMEQSEPKAPPLKADPADGQIRLFNPDGDLVMKINSQEQQITSLREQVNLLRRQLGESDRKLRTEQEKNRNLKGA
jgi:hypothetical protein